MSGRWTNSFLVRLLAPYFVALFAVAASFYVYGDRAVERLYVDTLAEAELRQARLIGSLLPWDLRGEALDRLCANYAREIGARITVIAGDGTVLGDSDAPSANLENHGGRPEVFGALREGSAGEVRFSASVKRPLFYQAWRQSRGPEQRIVRLAVPTSTIEGARGRIGRAIWSGVALAALASLWPAAALARRLSRRVSRLSEFTAAVTRGENPVPPAPERPDVIGRLEGDLVALERTLNERLRVAREERTKLAAILGGMFEGVLVVGPDGTLRLANRAVEELFGLAADASVGRALIEAVRQPDLHAIVAEAARGGAGGPPVTREMVLDGPMPRTLQVTASPLPAESPRERALVVVFHDVTALKQVEQSQRDFVANVSHELRTPMAAIRGYAETLLTGGLDRAEDARRFVGIIERHAERLGRLVDELLTLSDLELGRTTLRRGPTDTALVIDAVLEVMRGRADEAKLELVRELAPALPLADADGDRLEQALLNLVDNAVKYTPAGGRVVVSARPAATAAGTGSADVRTEGLLEIAVEDTGQGIPAKDLPRLTERFYRVDRARSRELGGTGLGLAIVRQIVQAHGGRMKIESQVGKGTVVRLFLPAAVESRPGASSAAVLPG